MVIIDFSPRAIGVIYTSGFLLGMKLFARYITVILPFPLYGTMSIRKSARCEFSHFLALFGPYSGRRCRGTRSHIHFRFFFGKAHVTLGPKASAVPHSGLPRNSFPLCPNYFRFRVTGSFSNFGPMHTPGSGLSKPI